MSTSIKTTFSYVIESDTVIYAVYTLMTREEYDTAVIKCATFGVPVPTAHTTTDDYVVAVEYTTA